MLKKILVITVFIFLGVVLPGLVIIPAQYLGVDPNELQGSDFNVNVGTVVTALLFSVGSIAFVYVVQRYYHRKPSFLELGFKRDWVRGLAWGHLVGAALIALPFLLVLAPAENVGIISTVPDSVSDMSLVGYYLFFLFMLTLNSFKEELLFRSYAIENIEGEATGNWTVILIASAVFSVVHLVLEPFTWTAFISRFLFGVFTCQVYVVTRSLWPIVGIHNGSNWLAVTCSGEGNWKMGGILTVGEGGLDHQPLEIDPIHALATRGLAVAVMYVWMRRWQSQPVEPEGSTG